MSWRKTWNKFPNGSINLSYAVCFSVLILFCFHLGAVHATKELSRREWRYHKEMGRWFKYEGGSYFYFDANAFEKRALQDPSVAHNLSQGFMTEQELAELKASFK